MRQGFNGFPKAAPSTWVEKRRVFADSLNTKDLAEIAGILGCSGGATKVALPAPHPAPAALADCAQAAKVDKLMSFLASPSASGRTSAPKPKAAAKRKAAGGKSAPKRARGQSRAIE